MLLRKKFCVWRLCIRSQKCFCAGETLRLPLCKMRCLMWIQRLSVMRVCCDRRIQARFRRFVRQLVYLRLLGRGRSLAPMNSCARTVWSPSTGACRSAARLAQALVRALPARSRFSASLCRENRLAEWVLQNFFTHIRKLPHFDTRFGVAQTCCSPPQKRAFSICAGRRLGTFLICAQHCSEWQFSASKRVSKWGNFLIWTNFFCKRQCHGQVQRGAYCI